MPNLCNFLKARTFLKARINTEQMAYKWKGVIYINVF